METPKHLKYFFSKTFQNLGQKSNEVNGVTEMKTLNPESAAQEVFDRLTQSEEDRAYVQKMGSLYAGEGYTSTDAANSILTYGLLSRRWFDPDDPNTHIALRDGLRRIFDIQLDSGSENPEKEFVEALGKRIVDFVMKKELPEPMT